MGSAQRWTGAAGRWSATHSWTVIVAWLGCVVIVLVTGQLIGTARQRVCALRQRQRAAAHPRIQIAETGDATIMKAINDTVIGDLHRAEALSFPITLLVLLIAFGAVVAALLPLGLAVMAILAAGGLVAFTSHLSGVTVQANSVMLLVGLAVGVDYSMFYLKRVREERARGRPVLDAIETAAVIAVSAAHRAIEVSAVVRRGTGCLEGDALEFACHRLLPPVGLCLPILLPFRLPRCHADVREGHGSSAAGVGWRR